MRLVWTSTAIAHLHEIQSYVGQDKPEAAARLADKLVAQAERLVDFPQLGRAGRKPDTRELVVACTPYIICYQVWRNRLFVLSVLHGDCEVEDQ